MRILQVSPLFYPHVGGIENHVEKLSNRLVEEGHEVTVYTSNIPTSRCHEVIGGLEIFRFKSIFEPLNNPVVPGILLKMIMESNFDVVHVHSHHHLSSNMAVLSKKLNGLPIILTSHGNSNHLVGWKRIIDVAYNKTIAGWMLRSADKVIALTPQHADDLKKLGARQDDVSIIPHGVNLPQINLGTGADKFKEKYGLEDKKVILFVGGLIPRKGLNYLVESMKYINKDTTLLIVGGEIQGHPGVKRSLEKRTKDLGIDGRVFFLGRLGKVDLKLAYISSDLFVFPSIADVFGLVILEAMSYGKCVVASRVPGPSSIIKDLENGVLFEPKNPIDLSKKVNYLLENYDLRMRLGNAARKEVERTYNWDTTFKRILDLYLQSKS